MHFKFEVKYLWEAIEVGVQEAGLLFLKTPKENCKTATGSFGYLGGKFLVCVVY